MRHPVVERLDGIEPGRAGAIRFVARALDGWEPESFTVGESGERVDRLDSAAAIHDHVRVVAPEAVR